jgi:hypothetical protein
MTALSFEAGILIYTAYMDLFSSLFDEFSHTSIPV